MAYFEGEIPTVVNGNGSNGNGMWGDGGWWAIILFAMIFGWGRGGYGFGGGNGGSENIGYELGKMATTNDVASGFNNSAVLSSLNDIKLGQAGIQQTLCQGFSGVNAAVTQNGYETRLGMNDLGYRMQDCCCQTQRAIEGVNYNMAKNTCDIIQAGNANTQRIIDYLTGEKISSLQAENSLLTAQLSQNSQTNTIINALRPVPQPAYITCSPYQSIFGYGMNNNCGCGL